MKKILAFSILLWLPLVLMGCTEAEPVAIINGEPISEELFNETLDRMKNMYANQIDFESEQGTLFLTQLEENVLDMLIQQAVIFQVAKAEGFLVPLSEAEAEVAMIKANFESDASFQEALVANVLTEARLIESLQQDGTIEAYFEAMIEVDPVTEEDIVAFYNEQKALAEEAEQDIPDLEEVYDLIEKELLERRKQAAANTLVEALMEAATIER